MTGAVLLLGLLAAQSAGASSTGSHPNRAALIRLALSQSRKTAGAFHKTKTIERVNLINGKNVVVDKRTVSLSVDVTNNLIDRQVLKVRWSGAHPTGGIQSNPNNGAIAQDQEYPMVLLECHGNPSASAPAAQQITPQKCWTSTPSERIFTAGPDTPFPPWRLDRYATASGQRNLTVNQPNPLPPNCGLLPGPHYWLNYVTPAKRSYAIGPGGCAGMPNEMSLVGGNGLLPSNETFAATNINGKGSASFDIWTSDLDADLGCSLRVSCALVAVPIMGISCDPAAATMPPADRPTPGTEEDQAAAQCEQTGSFAPGSPLQQGELGQNQLSVSGELWWAASNWRNRFVVPLNFAPPQNLCSAVTKGNNFAQIYGSELMDQAMLQWQPHFCTNKKLFTLGYVNESEPEAAGQLLTGTINAALVSDQPAIGFGKPVVHAPVADTAFAISFVIDNAAGTPVTTLRLDPRLLAKLLTESYPAVPDIANNDPEILHKCPGVPVPGSTLCTNPLNITLDPEFQALNPGITKGVGASAAASTLLALSSNSDVMRALTSYINSNPAAHAWLQGKPDPWGMTVNSAYKKKLTLPVSIWPLSSTFEPQDWKTGSGGPGYCFNVNPSPVLPLVAAPVPDLPDLAEDLQFYNSQSQIECNPNGNPAIPASEYLVALGQQTVGFRFMIGVTTLADAIRYGLGTASLLTYTKHGTPDKFTSASGMTFSPPTNASLRNATALFAPDKTNHVWTFPYALYGKDSPKSAGAYPGTMLVYADIPTKGLSKANAKYYSDFLSFAATTGQAPGGGIGQLPPGYLPMTTANHLGEESSYASRAGAAVAAQKGAIPALIRPSRSGHSSSPSPSPTPTASSTSAASASSGTGTSSASSQSGSASQSANSSPSPSGSSSARTRLALTQAASFGVAGYVLPAVGGLALLAAAAAGVIYWLTRARGQGRTKASKWG